MNELGIIRILHKRRARLLFFALAAGVLAAGVALLIPNKYSASAAISVQRPEVTLTGEIPPLSVETLRSLVESTRVKWDLYRELVKRGIIIGKMQAELTRRAARALGQRFSATSRADLFSQHFIPVRINPGGITANFLELLLKHGFPFPAFTGLQTVFLLDLHQETGGG